MAGVIERSWSDLPGGVLNTIVECLRYVDQIRFKLVCKSWRSNTNPMKHADKLPWVMYIKDELLDPFSGWNNGSSRDVLSKQCNSSSRGLFYLYDPSHKKKYTLHNSVLSGVSVHASKHGWLLLSPWIQHSSLFFYTPFTNEILLLPQLHIPTYNFARLPQLHIRATFSTAPTSPDCLIFVLTEQCKEICVSTCSPRDKTWKNHWFDGDHGQIDSVAFVGGVLYCLFSQAVMASFKVEQGEWRIHPHPSPVTNNATNTWIDHQFIESCDNNLLAKCLRLESPEQFFRYDQAEMRWLQIEDLGDRMLFLGITSMLLPAVGEASELANTIHRAGLMIGCSVSCVSYYFHEPYKGLLRTYNWIDKGDPSKKIWIQPIQYT